MLAIILIAGCGSAPREAGRSAWPSPELTACGWADARCGAIVRPIDPAARASGEIRIGFALFPHHDPALSNAGVIVATEGGPGAPTIESREAYLTLFAPLMGDHDLLLIDNRGSGRSGPIDCRVLQTMPAPTVEAVGACGRSLAQTANFYGAPMAADDMAAVLDALGVGKIDLYGDSFGTFTAQVFAQRHPDRVRSLVLDGAFATRGESPFFPATPAAIRRNVDLVCDRSAACRARPGRPLARLASLLDRLRARPVEGAPSDGGAGQAIPVRVDSAAIGTILYDSAYDPVNLRELDAAVRAALSDDDAPLLRLAAETAAHAESRDATGDPAAFSYGLFAAVSCMDYPQIYDMTAPPQDRLAQRDAALAEKRRDNPDIYAPLTIDEWRAMPLDYSILDLCLDWPPVDWGDTPAPYKPGAPTPQTGNLAAVPTLILSGDLDATTPPADGALAATAFQGARQIVLANSFHVDALDDEANCAAAIVRRFVTTLDAGDASCADRLPPLRLAPDFVRRAGQAVPAQAMTGNRGAVRDLALAAATVATAADVLERSWRNTGGLGPGLRGGRYAIERAGVKIRCTLQAVRWADDLAVSGRIDWDRHTGEVTGVLAIATPRSESGDLIIGWNAGDPGSRASINGKIGERPIHAWMPAP
jgi:pimeloyl-ACP methyl ester carboxylesterase